MMGITHATSGAAAWVAFTGAMPILTTGLVPLDPVGVLAGAAVCAGAALLPDADHHSGTIAQSVPVLGRLATSTVGAVSGGHRHGAHSAIGIIVAAAAAWALTLLTIVTADLGPRAVGVGSSAAALTAFGLKARDFVKNWLAAWALGGLLGAFLVLVAPEQLAWFPLAVVLGFIAHLAGDLLTTGGLPGMLWPWVPRPPAALRAMPVLKRVWLPNGYVALPLLGDTGSLRESILGTVLALYCFAGFGYEALLIADITPPAFW